MRLHDRNNSDAGHNARVDSFVLPQLGRLNTSQ